MSREHQEKARKALKDAIKEQKTYLTQHATTPIAIALLPELGDSFDGMISRAATPKEFITAAHKIATKLEELQGDKSSLKRERDLSGWNLRELGLPESHGANG